MRPGSRDAGLLALARQAADGSGTAATGELLASTWLEVCVGEGGVSSLGGVEWRNR